MWERGHERVLRRIPSESTIGDRAPYPDRRRVSPRFRGDCGNRIRKSSTHIRSIGFRVRQAGHLAEGKHGADSQVAAFARKTVQLRGTRIYRDNQTMIEVVSGSISLKRDSTRSQPPSQELGIFELAGEIVDSKCYLGVMNPGSGKVHRDCAVRCISGGIPPVFATNDFNGSPAILLLTDLHQKPLPKETFLKLVAQPVRIHGSVVKTGETLYLKTGPSAISPLP